MNKITKVVIPVAGKGTRFLPITKTISKTLLPIIDKPVIHYLLEEAISAGITEALIVIGNNQSDVIDYFDLESSYIESLNGVHYGEIENIRKLKEKIKISYVVQPIAKGLGDAVSLAKEFAHGEDFALILGDDFVYSNQEDIYGIGTLCKYYEQNQSYYLGVKEVPLIDTKKYGIVKTLNQSDQKSNYFEIGGIIEKPNSNPPSNMACVGRYILKNNIFEYLSNITYGVGNEIQLTDALDLALKEGNKIIAATFGGIRYDVGNKQGFVDAIVAIATSLNLIK